MRNIYSQIIGFYGLKSQVYTLNSTLVDWHRCRAADGVIDFLGQIKLKKKIEIIKLWNLFLQDFIKDTYEVSWTRLPIENFINDQLIYQIVWRIPIIS